MMCPMGGLARPIVGLIRAYLPEIRHDRKVRVVYYSTNGKDGHPPVGTEQQGVRLKLKAIEAPSEAGAITVQTASPARSDCPLT